MDVGLLRPRDELEEDGDSSKDGGEEEEGKRGKALGQNQDSGNFSNLCM